MQLVHPPVVNIFICTADKIVCVHILYSYSVFIAWRGVLFLCARGQSGVEKEWPLFVRGHDGKDNEIFIQVGRGATLACLLDAWGADRRALTKYSCPSAANL